jgi:RNA polymerase sigma factor (sigma-70 family)
MEEAAHDAAHEFAVLMEQVRAGDQEAARKVYERYSKPVRRVVRRWLEERMRRHYDSADFEQSVWASFFDVPAESCTFASPDALVAFLSRMAYHKVVTTTRQRLHTQRRGDGGELSLDALPEGGDTGPLARVLPAPTHTPSQFAMADERWQGLLQNLPPGHRRILELLREGHTQAEIADRLGVDRKIIRRLIDRLEELTSSS